MTISDVVIILFVVSAATIFVIYLAYQHILRCSGKLLHDHKYVDQPKRVGKCVIKLIGEYYK